jgi:hypothetical protein
MVVKKFSPLCSSTAAFTALITSVNRATDVDGMKNSTAIFVLAIFAS